MKTKLNPDMPAQELRLHMGELTEDEMLVARAAIRWANTRMDDSTMSFISRAPRPSKGSIVEDNEDRN